MDAILNYSPGEDEDFYALLGCDELASVEQILAEFKARALECHPDKHPEDPKAVETFQKLQKAKDTLMNEESRAHYDLWRRSQVAMPFQQWETFKDSVKTSMHWTVRGKKDLMLEESDETNKTETEGQNERRQATEENLGVSREKMEPVELESPGKSLSQDPDSASFSDMNCWHLRFRWSGDTPSELLRKFRNYEI